MQPPSYKHTTCLSDTTIRHLQCRNNVFKATHVKLMFSKGGEPGNLWWRRGQSLNKEHGWPNDCFHSPSYRIRFLIPPVWMVDQNTWDYRFKRVARYRSGKPRRRKSDSQARNVSRFLQRKKKVQKPHELAGIWRTLIPESSGRTHLILVSCSGNSTSLSFVGLPVTHQTFCFFIWPFAGDHPRDNFKQRGQMGREFR